MFVFQANSPFKEKKNEKVGKTYHIRPGIFSSSRILFVEIFSAKVFFLNVSFGLRTEIGLRFTTNESSTLAFFLSSCNSLQRLANSLATTPNDSFGASLVLVTNNARDKRD